MRHLSLPLVVAVLGGACSEAPTKTSNGPGIAVTVAALELPGVTDVCYDLAVTNEAGDPVWSQQGICASQYGSGADISYVGTCDATDTNGGGALNTVTLTIAEVKGPGGAPIADFIDPCAAPHNPDGCQRAVVCSENQDAPVTFNLTLMRQANQGFFDVAVNFSDVFCSAKVDCVDASGEALRLVHDPISLARVDSVVLALACTDGSAPGTEATTTHLYRDSISIVCGGVSYAVDPSGGPGNLYPAGVGAPDPLVQAMVFEGAEALTNQATGAPADKLYWNVALGLDSAWFKAQASGTTCYVRTRMTASEGPLPGGAIPLDATYPVIEVDVPLWTTGATGARQCSRHPLNGTPAGVATAYTEPAEGAARTFGFVASKVAGVFASAAVSGSPPPSPCVPSPCDVNATCTPTGLLSFSCQCGPGFVGTGLVCTPECDPVAHASDNASCGCPGIACDTDEICSNGLCECDPAAHASDNNSCGCPGTVCGAGEICSNGLCACDPVAHASDPFSCGCPGTLCQFEEICTDGLCVCDPAAHAFNPNSCGCPGIQCAAGDLCNNGVCQCDPFAHASDPNSCGCPGTLCAAGEICTGGVCECGPGTAGPDCSAVSASVSGLYAFASSKTLLSSDEGSTWTTVSTTGPSSQKFVSSGRLITYDDANNSVLVSGDGITWTTALDIGPEGTNASGWEERRFYKWLSIGDGHVFLSVRHIYCDPVDMFGDCTPNEIVSWRSDDGGLQWTALGTVPYGPPTWNHAGTWYANLWVNGSQTTNWVSSSDGITFTPTSCAIPVDGEDQTWQQLDGRLLHGWGSAIKESFDGGCTWTLRDGVPSNPAPSGQLHCDGARCVATAASAGAQVDNYLYVLDGFATSTLGPSVAENGFTDPSNVGRIWSGFLLSGDRYFHDCLRCQGVEGRRLAIFDLTTNIRTFTTVTDYIDGGVVRVP